jgi:hypothetical protein
VILGKDKKEVEEELNKWNSNMMEYGKSYGHYCNVR